MQKAWFTLKENYDGIPGATTDQHKICQISSIIKVRKALVGGVNICLILTMGEVKTLLTMWAVSWHPALPVNVSMKANCYLALKPCPYHGQRFRLKPSWARSWSKSKIEEVPWATELQAWFIRKRKRAAGQDSAWELGLFPLQFNPVKLFGELFFQ